MTVGRSRDGVPSWDGEPSTWTEYRRAALLFVESTKWSNRYLCGPRLATELSGPAKASIAGKKPTWLSREDGVQRLLTHLQTAISEPVLPEVGNALRAYFKTLRRRCGETMTSFCVRNREEYEKACRALTRMMASQQPQPDLRKSSSSKPTSRRSSWREVAPQTLGPELRNSTPSVTTPQNGSQGATQEATASANQAGLDGSNGPGETDESTDPWQTWYNDNGDGAWSQTGGSSWGQWWSQGWDQHWHESQWRARDSESEDEEDLVEVLPDVIKGWLLLEKAGLDTLEKSIIQSDIKSQFTLLNVENSLRAHWTDEQIRRRDGDSKAQAHFEDYEDEAAPEELPDSFFEEWDAEDIILFQNAQRAEADAWAQLQQARRTLKDARERQKEVRLGRRFYPKGKGRGHLSGGSGHARGPPQSSSSGPEGPCLRCGKAHSTRNCPVKSEQTDKRALQVDAESEFIFHAEAESFYGDHVEEALTMHDPDKLTTQQAMRAGFGVLDPGATRTMGSITALEHAREASWQSHHRDNIAEVNTEDRPTFGFANSETARCSSTVLLQVPIAEQDMKLRVHSLDQGTVPILLSIQTLHKMGAIVDYGRNEAVFTRINPLKCLQLQTTTTGHQILPLTRDFMQRATVLQAPVHRLGVPAEE